MSLVKKAQLTGRKIKANRRNGRKPKGPKPGEHDSENRLKGESPTGSHTLSGVGGRQGNSADAKGLRPGVSTFFFAVRADFS